MSTIKKMDGKRVGPRGKVVASTSDNAMNANATNADADAPGDARSEARGEASAFNAHLTQLIDVSGLPPESAVETLIEHAAKLAASDLFFVANEQHIAALVRHLGIIRPVSVLGVEHGRKCLSHIKVNSGMDLSEKRRPTDGRWIFNGADEPVDLRINVIPTLYGEDFAIRLLTRGNRLFQLDQLGMTSEQISSFERMINSPAGLILITGPTGSGKTGTLYASLIKLNNGKRKINTIEDPVEYAIDGLRQSQVNPLIDLGFGELLRSVLRQSPDVIMIGEIRDEETARTAVRAANSGMLVFATLHSVSAAGAVQSMRSLGANPHFLSTGLIGVVAQRLVRTLDPENRNAFDVSDAPDTFDEVKRWLKPGEGKKLYAAKPAESNGWTGYTGRTGVFEVMPVSRAIRKLIADGGTAAEIRDQALAEKMLEFRSAAMLKVARGQTSTEEIFRVAPTEQIVADEEELD